MTSVMATRILCVLKALHRPQQCLSRCLHHSLGLSTSHSTKTDCLGRISSTISQHMKDEKSQSKLLVVHNPVDEMLLQKLKSQGVENLWCTVGSDEHLQLLNERLKSIDPSHDLSDNVTLCRLTVTDSMEKDILDSAGPVEGVVILSSMVAATNPGFFRFILNKRLTTPSTERFYGLNSVEWFCLVPTYYIQFLNKKIASVKYFWTFHDLNACYDIPMNCEEAMSLFKPLDVKAKVIKIGGQTIHYKLDLTNQSRSSKVDRRTLQYKLDLAKQSQTPEFSLLHIVPKFQQTSLEERKMFKNYLIQLFKNDRLLPFAEQCVPGCGKDLIYQGYSFADEVKDLSGDRLFHAFKVITSHPEYEGSVLQTMLEKKYW